MSSPEYTALLQEFRTLVGTEAVLKHELAKAQEQIRTLELRAEQAERLAEEGRALYRYVESTDRAPEVFASFMILKTPKEPTDG